MFAMFKVKTKNMRSLDTEDIGFVESIVGNSNSMLVEQKKPRLINLADKLHPAFDSRYRRSTVFAGMFNIICTSLDGTSLSLPFVIAKCGIIVGPVIIVSFALCTVFTLQAICICSRKLGATTYPTVTERLFGTTSRVILSILLFLILFAVIVGFLILMRQIGTKIVAFITSYAIPPVLIMLCGTVLSFPLMLRRSLYQLRYSCYISCLSVVCLLLNMTALVIYHSSSSDSGDSGGSSGSTVHTKYHNKLDHGLQWWPRSTVDVLESIPIVTILYLSHFNVLGVANQLKQPTVQRMGAIIYSAMGVLATIFVAFGVVGYLLSVLLFGPNYLVSDNILDIFPAKDESILFGRSMLLITILCTIPVMMVPSRELLHEIRQCVELPAAQFAATMRRHRVILRHPIDFVCDYCRSNGQRSHNYRPPAVQTEQQERAQHVRHKKLHNTSQPQSHNNDINNNKAIQHKQLVVSDSGYYRNYGSCSDIESKGADSYCYGSTSTPRVSSIPTKQEAANQLTQRLISNIHNNNSNNNANNMCNMNSADNQQPFSEVMGSGESTAKGGIPGISSSVESPKGVTGLKTPKADRTTTTTTNNITSTTTTTNTIHHNTGTSAVGCGLNISTSPTREANKMLREQEKSTRAERLQELQKTNHSASTSGAMDRDAAPHVSSRERSGSPSKMLQQQSIGGHQSPEGVEYQQERYLSELPQSSPSSPSPSDVQQQQSPLVSEDQQEFQSSQSPSQSPLSEEQQQSPSMLSDLMQIMVDPHLSREDNISDDDEGINSSVESDSEANNGSALWPELSETKDIESGYNMYSSGAGISYSSGYGENGCGGASSRYDNLYSSGNISVSSGDAQSEVNRGDHKNIKICHHTQKERDNKRKRQEYHPAAGHTEASAPLSPARLDPTPSSQQDITRAAEERYRQEHTHRHSAAVTGDKNRVRDAQVRKHTHKTKRLRSTVTETILTLVIITLAFITSLLVPDSVAVVWQIVGSLMCIAVAVLIPAVLYIQLVRVLGARRDIYFHLAWCGVAVSAPLIVVCTYHNIQIHFE